jgi:hypothetical protein
VNGTNDGWFMMENPFIKWMRYHFGKPSYSDLMIFLVGHGDFISWDMDGHGYLMIEYHET